MYKLWIQNNESGDWTLADLGNDNPAMNYQSNDITELKNRNNNYSQAIRLPISKNNAKIFGFADDFDVLAREPYQQHNCRLECNGFMLAGKGSYLILDRVSQYFECQILSGNADLFAILRDADMSELDLGYFDRLEGAENISEFYAFAAATFRQGGARELNFSIAHSYPFVFIEPVIKKMLNSHGFKLEHNLGRLLSDKAISLSSINASPDSFDNFGFKCVNNPHVSSSYIFFDIISDITNSLESTIYGLYYRPIFQGSVRFRTVVKSKVDTTNVYIGAGSIYNTTIDLEMHTFDLQKTGPAGGEKIYESPEIRFAAGDEIRYRCRYPVPALPMESYTVEVTLFDIKADNLSVPLGGRVHISPNLGFYKQLDFFKIFVQCFGLTIKVDNTNKIVYANTMDVLYDNKHKAVDWSAKLHNGNNGITTFSVKNYAQRNIISFNDNTDDDVIDSGQFFIKNTTLEISKELFKIDLQAGRDNPVPCTYWNRYGGSGGGGLLTTGYLDIANIPLEDSDGNFKGCKPHLIEVSSVIFAGLPTNDLPSHSAAFTIKAQSLIDNYYNKLTTEMLKYARVVEEEFYLTEQDIEDFDQFVPVYVNKFGAYFYVNKIKNYISGRLTKCELIKL